MVQNLSVQLFLYSETTRMYFFSSEIQFKNNPWPQTPNPLKIWLFVQYDQMIHSCATSSVDMV